MLYKDFSLMQNPLRIKEKPKSSQNMIFIIWKTTYYHGYNEHKIHKGRGQRNRRTVMFVTSQESQMCSN